MNLNVLSTDHMYKRHHEEWNGCQRCVIGSYAHHHVFYRGTLPCDFLFIGEGPGVNEDKQGEPFVGRSGELLNHWITEASVQMCRRDPVKAVFAPTYEILNEVPILFKFAITNLVCCRPTDYPKGPNRAPSIQEMANCRPRLVDFVKHIAKPKYMILVGKPAQRNAPEWAGIPVLKLAHPAWVLRRGGRDSVDDREQCRLLTEFVVSAKIGL